MSRTITKEKSGKGVRSHIRYKDEGVTMRLSELVELQIEFLEFNIAETSFFQLR